MLGHHNMLEGLTVELSLISKYFKMRSVMRVPQCRRDETYKDHHTNENDEDWNIRSPHPERNPV